MRRSTQPFTIYGWCTTTTLFTQQAYKKLFAVFFVIIIIIILEPLHKYNRWGKIQSEQAILLEECMFGIDVYKFYLFHACAQHRTPDRLLSLCVYLSVTGKNI